MRCELKNIYDSEFYANQRDESYLSATIMLGFIIDRIKPTSVIDFGCGTGSWLLVASERGISDYIGLDGDYVDHSLLFIPQDKFIPSNLNIEIQLNKKFDLALSMEVAEHLNRESADTFVSSICKHTDIVLFSAATPHQGGTNHVNEQPLSYWNAKFEAQNYQLLDCLRAKFWNDKNIPVFYRQNAVLFVKKNIFDEISNLFTSIDLIDVIHPELFDMKMESAENKLFSRYYLQINHPLLWKVLLKLYGLLRHHTDRDGLKPTDRIRE
jgi:SAM-dependent methyltransferase